MITILVAFLPIGLCLSPLVWLQDNSEDGLVKVVLDEQSKDPYPDEALDTLSDMLKAPDRPVLSKEERDDIVETLKKGLRAEKIKRKKEKEKK
jgi:hypothetical protein